MKRLEPEAGQGTHCPLPQAHPSRLQILVAVVQYQTRLKEPRRGLCSNWLASLDPGQGDPGSLGRGAVRRPRFPACTTASPGLGPWASELLHAASLPR